MKRLLIFLLILCVVPVIAFGVDEVEVMLYGHNIYASLTGAQEVTGEAEITVNGENTLYSYTVNGVDFGYVVKEGKVKTCFCRAKEENAGELLSQAASALYNICGTDSISYWYVNLFDQFLTARAGKTSETNPYVNNVCMFQIERKNGIYTFIAAILY